MNILVITPAEAGSRAGNRATALRYQALLLEAGHQCRVTQQFECDQSADAWPIDCVIVLHAIRGRYAAAEASHRGIPLVVMLTGTDYYKFQLAQPVEFDGSLQAADVLICLHDLAYRSIPERFHSKLHVVKQSVAFIDETLLLTESDNSELNKWLDAATFPIALVGHLREEKAPFITAHAAELLPMQSGIQILHAGSAHDSSWALQANHEMRRNERYHWLGELTRSSIRQLLTRARLMVISSIMEGGANIISEACALGCPIIASNIDGNLGLLGSAYPGVYQVGDKHGLMAQLLRCENDPAYLVSLEAICQRLAADFTPALETAGLLNAIACACSISK